MLTGPPCSLDRAACLPWLPVWRRPLCHPLTGPMPARAPCPMSALAFSAARRAVDSHLADRPTVFATPCPVFALVACVASSTVPPADWPHACTRTMPHVLPVIHSPPARPVDPSCSPAHRVR